MAPLSPDNTARVYLDYSVAGFEHTLIARYASLGDISTTVAHMADFVNAFGTQLYLSTFIGLRASAVGSSVTFPVSETFPATWGSTDVAGDETANYYDLIGRSVDGRRVRAAMFGAKNQSSADKFRLSTSLGAPWSDVLDVLTTAFPSFCTISGLEANWHAYVNLGMNAHWRNKIR